MSSSDAAIHVRGVSKQYRLGDAGTGGAYRTLGDALAAALRRRPRTRGETFWALRDVDAEFPAGRVTGLIGVNGAGKSTLLKILARITPPTAGRVAIRGRVASLLEVGTGFHQELTGRENTFLNGAILGMSRRETRARLDEIVAFAGVERFLDTPVKHYSSGMYLRLAFSIAAHLEPEILLVDEVLAVGDLAFQRRSMQRMREVCAGGRTVLLVSHSMAAIESICHDCLLLDEGRAAAFGPVREVTREYRRRIDSQVGPTHADLSTIEGPNRRERIFLGLRLIDDQNESVTAAPLGGPCRFEIDVDGRALPPDAVLLLRIDDRAGQRFLTVRSPVEGLGIGRVDGRARVRCTLRYFPGMLGEYHVGLACRSRGEQIDAVDRAIGLRVVGADAFGEGWGAAAGLCVAPSEWTVEPGDGSGQ